MTAMAFINVNNAQVSIGFIGRETEKSLYGERLSAFNSIKNHDSLEVQFVPWKLLKKLPEGDRSFDILWYHRCDTNELIDDETDSRLIQKLKNYVNAGGNLVLTQDAIRMLKHLGVESHEPAVQYVEANDEGYGRKLGMHAYRKHQVFDGLYGGAYLYAPSTDRIVRQMGWFGQVVPDGKIIAVDWAYIHLKEDNKLITEYNLGKGKILAIGSYMVFNSENQNARVVEMLLSNIFRYLKNATAENNTYWNFHSDPDTELKTGQDTVLILPSEIWNTGADPLMLRRKFATDNFVEVAGERMLLIGKENGGIDEIWSHPFMSLRDYKAGISFEGNDSVYYLNKQQCETEIRPGSITRIYRFRRAYLKEIISCHPEEPIAAVHYEYNGISAAQLHIEMKSNLRFMWPYSEKVTGTLKHTWHPGLQALIISNQEDEFATLVGSNKKPLQQLAGKYDSFSRIVYPVDVDRMIRADSVYTGLPSQNNQISALFLFQLKAADRFDIVITASEQGYKKAVDTYRKVIPRPQWVHLSSLRYYENLFKSRTIIQTDNERFNQGYQWSLIGSDRFFINTPGVGRSLAAGYATTAFGWDGGHKINGRPGYAWFFGRDGVWSSYALLQYGDFEKVKAVLELFVNYQDLSGKIFHELTTSGVAHYDAADATPLFISLADRYMHHSGDTSFIRSIYPAIQKAILYCYSTDTDNDGLIENTLVGHGWEEGGFLFGTHTTLYLASCWAEALKSASSLANAMGDKMQAMEFARDEGRVKVIINQDFWNSEKSFFNHGKYPDGSYHTEPAVMAAVPLLFGQVNDSLKAEKVLCKLAGQGFTTDWGTRIVDGRGENFKPGSYHQGSVWPLFTGWASLAAFYHHRTNQGYELLMDNLLTYRSRALGYAPEVLHGTEYKPFGVCYHQCWSETMVSLPALQGLIGIKPDAIGNSLIISPNLPADWDTLSVQNIRMGKNFFHLAYSASELKETWKIKKEGSKDQTVKLTLNLYLRPGTKLSRILVDGKEVESIKNNSLITLQLLVRQESTVELFRVSGPAVLPEISEPENNAMTEGARLIAEELKGNTYKVTLEGKSGSETKLRIHKGGYNLTPLSAEYVSESDDNNVASYRYHFPEADQPFITKTLSFSIAEQQ